MDEDRRTLISGGAALGVAAALPAALPAAAAPSMPDRLPVPPLLFAFRATIEIGTPIELGASGDARKRVIPITGGSFAGPDIAGVVLSGGADWQSIRADGTADILARYTLRATDGTPISVVNPGYRHGPAAVIAQLGRGEDVDPALYYFRTTPQFAVADASPHAWLGRHAFVCTAARFATRVVLDCYRIG